MLKIRFANETDYAIVSKMATELQNFHVNMRPDVFVKHENSMPKEFFDNLLLDNSILVLEDEEIKGYAIISINQKYNPNKIERKLLLIDAIGIKEKFRNKGLGGFLFEKIKEYAKEQGCIGIELGVDDKNVNAKEFYKKMGMYTRSLKKEIIF